MSESVPTQQLIGLLNDLFSAFDLLTEKHGVFKAETIGDAYIVAAGHEGQAGPSDATLRVVEFGLEMLEKVKTIRPPSGMQLQIRVGIHTGPAYSGVVGTKVPKYSFFGDSELVCVLEVECSFVVSLEGFLLLLPAAVLLVVSHVPLRSYHPSCFPSTSSRQYERPYGINGYSWVHQHIHGGPPCPDE